MKLPITDQFLWDLYYSMPSAEGIVDFILNPRSIKLMPGLRNPVFEKYRKEKGAKSLARLIYYLKVKNYIRIRNLEGKRAVILTKEGIGKILRASFKIEGKNKRKDGKWIMIIFDVPKNREKSRELLRSILRNLGYKILQYSVWITPYDIFEKTEKLLQMHSLDKYVKIFLIEKL